MLSSVHLASFSLQECVHVLLGRRLELLPPSALAHLAGLPSSPGPRLSASLIPLCIADLPAPLPFDRRPRPGLITHDRCHTLTR